MGSPEPQRHTEALSAAHCNVCPPLAGSLQQSQRQQIRSKHHQSARFMGLLDQGGVVAHLTGSARILDQDTEHFVTERRLLPVTHHHLKPQRFGPRPDQIDVLRMAIRSDPEGVPFGIGFLYATAQRHRFGAGCRLIQK